MASRIAQYASRLIESGWLIAVIAIPLFFNVWSNRVFEPDKLTLLRSIALMMVAAAAVLVVESGVPRVADVKRWLRTPMVAPVLVMTAVIAFASIFSIVPRFSVFGSYNRLQGLYTWLAYVVVFLAIVTLLKHREQLDRLILAIILPSLPVGLYGIVQKFGLDPMPWLGDVVRRVASTMGNSIFVAAYLIMAVPLTLVQLAAALRALDKNEGNAAVLRVSGYLVLLAVQVMAVVFSQSRGPMLGLLGGTFFLLLLMAALRGRKAMLAALGLGAAGAAFLVVFNIPNSPLAPLRDVPYLGRMGRVFETQSGTGHVRVLIWEGAVDLIASNPRRAIVGYGPESMHIAYNPFYPPDLAHYESRNASPDRSHNETLDVLVQAGVIGLVAYLLLFTSLFYYGLKYLGFIQGSGQRNLFLALWFGGGIVSAVGFQIWSRSATYVGVALPAGLIAGLFAFVALQALRGWQPGRGPGMLVVAGLVAALISHFIEIHFGIAIAATRTVFFAMMGAMVVVGTMPEAAGAPVQDAPTAARDAASPGRRKRARRVDVATPPAPRAWTVEAFIVLTIMITLVYDLLVVAQPQRSSFWLVLAWILGLCWGIGSLIVATEIMATNGGSTKGAWRYVGVSLGGTAAYVIVHGAVLWSGAATGGGAGTSSLLLSVYYLAGLSVMLGWAYAMSRSEPSPTAISSRAPWLYPVLVALAAVIAFVSNVNNIRADIYYKQAYENYHKAAGRAEDSGDMSRAQTLYGLAQQNYDAALTLNPREDYYMLFKGKALLEQASGLATQLDTDLGTRKDAAGFSEYDLPAADSTLVEQVTKRDDVFGSALDTLQKALKASPLNTDHSANLGRAYQVWGDDTLDAAKHEERLAESVRWFETAIKLSPNNAQLREELAMTYYLAGDRDNAFKRIDESIAIDPEYGRPYRLRGTIYREEKDWPAAEEDYRRYAATKDGVADVYGWSALAFVLGQENKLADARTANEKVLALLAPNEDLPTLRNLVLITRDLNDVAASCDYLERGLALAPDDAGLLQLREELNCASVTGAEAAGAITNTGELTTTGGLTPTDTVTTTGSLTQDSSGGSP